MTNKRKDSKGRNLKGCEIQQSNGRYKYQWTDAHSDRKAVYSWRLVPTDRLPPGKRIDLSLREKEEQIERDRQDGIDGRAARKIILNEVFALYMADKRDLKQSTATNYKYMYNKYIFNTLGKKRCQASNIVL